MGSTPAAQAQLIGPTSYVGFAGSPLSGLTFTDYFFLETFEDLLLNTPGLASSAAIGPIGLGGLTDSVDADDGTIDGNGTNGRSFFNGDGALGISFTFNAATLGGLPTHAGIVWTDGVDDVTFSAFDGANNLLGTTTQSHADGNFSVGRERIASTASAPRAASDASSSAVVRVPVSS